MTFRELFEKIDELGLMDEQYGVQYRDEGGFYTGWAEEDDELGIQNEIEFKDGRKIYLL